MRTNETMPPNAMPNNRIKLSLITPSLNPGAALKRCLSDIGQQIAQGGYQSQIEHVIVDGKSCDGSIAVLENAKTPCLGCAISVNMTLVLSRQSIKQPS